jgi:signal transduction histidine kinase
MNTSAFHQLLKRQINKHLTQECLQHPHFQNFIKSVNDSYLNFDRDKELFEHSALLNEKEFGEINNKLKEEIAQRKLSVDKLIEAIHSLEIQEGLESKSLDPNNLLGLVDFLQVQIENRKRIESELRLAKEAAERATQAKSEFLSMMSHEIRTPLNAIVGLTYIMQQEEVPPALAENLKILKFSTDNLYVLINDILDFSKIEAGKIELEQNPFDLKQLISNIKKANQIKAEENGNKIKLMIDDDVPDSLIGDALRLGQVISNLVSNAVKFTKKGSVTVELSLQKKVDQVAFLEISVTDTGIGIPPEKQQIIFDKFTQANSATTRQFGGTGLGLVITKLLLQLHDSDIYIESEAGKGSRFFFTIALPIGNALIKSKAGEDPNEVINDYTLKGVKILLVEDYAVNVKIATKFFEKWKIEVDIAENGQIAVDKFEKEKYDIILMDIQMPIMDGYTATQKIREADTDIPIIALTASASLGNQGQAYAAGINDYVTKPFNPKELFLKIAHYTGRT